MGRHPHKGTRTKRALLDHVPLMYMTHAELEDSFDDMGLETDIALLKDARAGQTEIVIAAAVLHRPGEPDSLITYTCEYGDEDGTEMIKDTMRRIRRLRLLKPGETLQLETIHLKLGDLTYDSHTTARTSQTQSGAVGRVETDSK